MIQIGEALDGLRAEFGTFDRDVVVANILEDTPYNTLDDIADAIDRQTLDPTDLSRIFDAGPHGDLRGILYDAIQDSGAEGILFGADEFESLYTHWYENVRGTEDFIPFGPDDLAYPVAYIEDFV